MSELREGNIMYSYEWDETTGGLLLTSSLPKVSKEPRPVYYQELDLLGFDKHWIYEKNDAYPYTIPLSYYRQIAKKMIS